MIWITFFGTESKEKHGLEESFSFSGFCWKQALNIYFISCNKNPLFYFFSTLPFESNRFLLFVKRKGTKSIHTENYSDVFPFAPICFNMNMYNLFFT
jgi:hypothetical protein